MSIIIKISDFKFRYLRDVVRELNLLEDILNDMPRFITTRGEVYDYLLGSARECLRS